jgi:hypothetical protein
VNCCHRRKIIYCSISRLKNLTIRAPESYATYNSSTIDLACSRAGVSV